MSLVIKGDVTADFAEQLAIQYGVIAVARVLFGTKSTPREMMQEAYDVCCAIFATEEATWLK